MHLLWRGYILSGLLIEMLWFTAGILIIFFICYLLAFPRNLPIDVWTSLCGLDLKDQVQILTLYGITFPSI